MLITRLPAEEAAKAAGLTSVLVVDDDDLIRGVTQLLLEPFGLSVTSASSGSTAVEHLTNATQRTDVVLLDCSLRDETGLEVFQKLRAVNPKIKVVFFSGFQPTPEIAALCAQGDAWFVQKPFKGADLVHLLARACASEARQKEVAA